jgi:3-dehydroquinate dehydratase-2
MSRVLLVNGPNLGLLGKRQPSIYGHASLSDVEKTLRARLALVRPAQGQPPVSLDAFQHDVEGELVAHLGRAFLAHDSGAARALGLIFNPGAYTHTSIALRDACEMLGQAGIPLVEVHLSNVFARESFRHHSFLSPVAKGVIAGLGVQGYALALEALLAHNGLA